MIKSFVILCSFVSACFVSLAQLPAFPGAEGAGIFTSGGRGTTTNPTTVFEVTSLDDNMNPGSLRYALSQAATYRTIVFRISGTIHLQSKLIIKANTTIAGQTAPGAGICIADHPVTISGDNVIIRYIRIRMGDRNQNLGMVAGSGNDDALENLGNKNIIIDHCSISWSSDEALTIYRGDSITLQWNIISEPLNYSYHFEAGGTDFQEHAYIGIWGARKASFHHNLLAHAKGRMPRFSGSNNYPPGTAGQENADFRNNVVYNWGSYSSNGGEGGNYNLVNNFYKYGPSTSTGSSAGVPIRNQVMNPYKSGTLPYPKMFISGNYVDGSVSITQANWRGVSMNGGSQADTSLSKVNTPFSIAEVTTHEATIAYDLVLKNAGVVLPSRDTLDERIVLNVMDRTGKLIDVQGGFPHGTPYAQTINAWPFLATAAAPADTDKDGMPDAWEIEWGLNPNNPADRNVIAYNGYTQLENYINSLASDAIILKASLNTFNQNAVPPSSTQTYLLSAKNLTGNLFIKAPVGFEVSVDGTNWYGSNIDLVLAPVNGVLTPMNIYVRLNSNSAGNYPGVIRHKAVSGTYIDLPVSGLNSSVTSVLSPGSISEIRLYPNPAGAAIRIDHPVLTTAVFKIYAADGRMIRRIKGVKGSHKTDIVLTGIPAGLYFIELADGKKKMTTSFTKL